MSTTKVAVIGLGNMGIALARSFQGVGTKIKVWNRSPEKTVALRAEGAVAASSVSDAIDGCSVVVVCLANYAAWKQLTDDETVRAKLKGVTVVQLTGGTIPEVEHHAQLMSACGAQLIEGAILCFPEQIGTDGASIVVAGPKDLIKENLGTLRIMSPNTANLGENYVAPVVLSRAAISSMLSFLIGTINGAAMCMAGGVPLTAFRDQVAENAGLMQSEPLRLIDAIAAGDTRDTQASLAVWAEGHEALLDVARRLGIETLFHDGIKSMFEKAIQEGFGNFDLSAMEQSFRQDQAH